MYTNAERLLQTTIVQQTSGGSSLENAKKETIERIAQGKEEGKAGAKSSGNREGNQKK